MEISEKLLHIVEQIEEKSKTVSMEDIVMETKEKIRKAVADSKPIRDSYNNRLLAVGGDDKVENFTNYGFSTDTLDFQLWLALYNDSWVFRRAIDKPAQDEIRCGITIQGDADYTKVYADLKRHRSDFIDLAKWGALFGGSVAVIIFDNINDDEYREPMRADTIRNSKRMRLYIADRWYGVSPSTETVTDMGSEDFGKPKFYTITMADGRSVTYHHDYVLRYEHRTAPRLVKSILQGWGYAEGSHIINELARDDKLKAAITSLINKCLIEVIKMDGMKGLFLSDDAQSRQQIESRLEMVNWGRSFNSLTFLDTNDDYQMNSFSGLTGLSDLLENNMSMVAAAVEMPGVLFGDLSKGLSVDADALERYDETINNRCESFIRPIYQKFLKILFIQYGIEGTPEFEFNSMLTKKHDEEKVQNISQFVDLCSKLLSDGIIEPTQYAEAVKNYSLKGIVDFGLNDETIGKLKERSMEELENIDIDA